jgi:hypothetical protein
VLSILHQHTGIIISQEFGHNNPEQQNVNGKAEEVQVFRHFLYDFRGQDPG